MFKLKPIIFNYFGRNDKTTDSNKDSNGKGTNERFQEILASDWDTELLPLIESLIDNTLIATTVWERFIPYLEQAYGIEVLVDDMAIRRGIIKNWIPLMKVKGTYRSYDILFKLLGFEVLNIEDVAITQGLDSQFTFDDPARRFDDDSCNTCSYYNLNLYGSQPLTLQIINLILRAVKIVEPINAKLLKVTFNDIVLDFSIFVEANGDLIFNNELEVPINITLAENGDLIVDSENAQNYFINNGNLLRNGD